MGTDDIQSFQWCLVKSTQARHCNWTVSGGKNLVPYEKNPAIQKMNVQYKNLSNLLTFNNYCVFICTFCRIFSMHLSMNFVSKHHFVWFPYLKEPIGGILWGRGALQIHPHGVRRVHRCHFALTHYLGGKGTPSMVSSCPIGDTSEKKSTLVPKYLNDPHCIFI